jgi:hypothetical protein
MAQHEPSADVPIDPRRPPAPRGNKLLVGGALVLVAIQVVRFAVGGAVEPVVAAIAVVVLVLLLVSVGAVRAASTRRLAARVQMLRPEAVVVPCSLSAEGHAALRSLGVPTTGLSGIGGSVVALLAGPPGVELWRKPGAPQRVIGLDWSQAGLARGSTAVGLRRPAALVLAVDGHRVPLLVTTGLGLRLPVADVDDSIRRLQAAGQHP